MSETNELTVTTGEWMVDGINKREIVSVIEEKISDGSLIKYPEPVALAESEPDAHLMAASKELYEALVIANKALDRIFQKGVESLSFAQVGNLQARIGAALAKAREGGDV